MLTKLTAEQQAETIALCDPYAATDRNTRAAWSLKDGKVAGVVMPFIDRLGLAPLFVVAWAADDLPESHWVVYAAVPHRADGQTDPVFVPLAAGRDAEPTKAGDDAFSTVARMNETSLTAALSDVLWQNADHKKLAGIAFVSWQDDETIHVKYVAFGVNPTANFGGHDSEATARMAILKALPEEKENEEKPATAVV